MHNHNIYQHKLIYYGYAWRQKCRINIRNIPEIFNFYQINTFSGRKTFGLKEVTNTKKCAIILSSQSIVYILININNTNI